jgi:hypothetical protein
MTDDTKIYVKQRIENGFDKWLKEDIKVKSIEVKTDLDEYLMVVELSLYLKKFDKDISVIQPYSY